MLQQILNYWYQQEFFNPCWPVKLHEDIDLTKQSLPWERPQSDSKKRVSYDIYIGKAKANDLIVWMLDTLKLNPEDAPVENDNSLVCLCALKVDEQGKYVADSFAISSFVWAICKLVIAGSLNEKLDVLELEKLQQKINDHLWQDNEEACALSVSKDYLNEIDALVCNSISAKEDLFKPTLWARKKVQYANKEGQFPPLDPSTELLQSFYLKDIKKVQNAPTQKICRYVEAMISSQTQDNRIQIDTDTVQMQQWLKAKAFPLGAWPSKFSPSLMQQLGINIAISGKQDIFSVNGPPGTGKTTLLKEIVASNVIQRAVVMAGYDTPDQAFVKTAISNPPDQYNQSFYRVDPNLTAFGMIVASNNNAAVENISVELPKAIAIDRTGRFSCKEAEMGDTYFADIATQLLGKPAWGLISAKLGKKSNLKALKDRLWWADDGITLKRYFEESVAPDWNIARQNFAKALQDVIAAQENIAQVQVLLQKRKQAEAQQAVSQEKYDKAQEEYISQNEVLASASQEETRLESKQSVQHQNMDTLKSQIPFLKKLFWKLFKNDLLIKEWKQVEQDLQETTILLTRQRTVVQMQREIVQAAHTQSEMLKQELNHAKEKLESLKQAIAPYQKLFGENWADDAFWQNISENKSSQTACPWTYADYDKLREELFYQALMLHKAFILSGNCVKQNLMRLFAMWDGKFIAGDCNAIYGDLLNTLLLVIPVISTTFASVQSFLEGIQKEELGILVVDEAGQATPQSALGALWRTKNAIIVGDPLQVEPIVTIPSELRKRFADENEIPPVYRLPELSVQMLADQLNLYGGIRNMDGEKLWLGCPLVVHRRCINPMFQISNEVAYSGRMFLKTENPEQEIKFLLQQSVWLDIKGSEKGNKNHTVPQQIAAVANLFSQALEVYCGLPDLYIITPFTSVDTALKEAIRPLIKGAFPEMDFQDISDWLKEHCGTIHTFQGKEANEVLLVLGCDAQTGKGAAHWVGQKPNIINVAVSRAKYRLGIIGDYNLWKDIPYVQTACKYLKS